MGTGVGRGGIDAVDAIGAGSAVNSIPKPLWTPSPERVANANLTRFMAEVRRDFGADVADYESLYRWSLAAPDAFWRALWSFGGIIAETQGTVVVRDVDKLPGATWFPEAKLNFAENLLRRRDRTPALVFRGENGATRTVSHGDLYDAVSRLALALLADGVAPGDRVVGFLPNIPEAAIAMLASLSIGAVWSSCSPDFGIRGVIDRFGQIAPKVLFVADGYFYNGKILDSLERVRGVAAELGGLTRLVVVPFVAERPSLAGLPAGTTRWDDYTTPFRAQPIAFRRLPFNHPIYILYSSGTTGVPKCIVHGAGGTLLQHLKEHLLHADVKPGDRLFYFTTCGWMMWNWLMSGLASEATLMLYDGSPFHPDGNVLFDFAAAERINVFGTSAKFIDACAKADLSPKDRYDLGALETVLSTGSPLRPEGFDWVYARVKPNVCLSSISGGTDLIACFAAGNPIGPVWRGEIQVRALGMKVEVFDEQGRPLVGEKGELVCTQAFPSMPVMFWNDPDGAKYRAAYFETYPNVWRHGDWVALTEHRGLIIYGRSDAVLNPGGVRIGTAEIYREVEQIDDVLEALVIGQDWDGDVRIVLFVKLRPGRPLDDALVTRIKKQIRDNATPRHVPAKILAVADIPRTISGKIVELAVRNVVHGRPVKNVDALANPEALEYFKNRPELTI
ncbi:MAG: acetoacetate--CoA ligase [Alphaproteobacteria bacterium]|nr:acetoacetate--CoA ligase [Alphaproteobacteria bacterium]